MSAALELFVERGVAATSIEDIRAATGSSVGSIYHHFGSKENIAASIYAESLIDYQQGALNALRRSHGTRDGLTALVLHWLSWVESNASRAKLLLLVDHRDVRELGAGEAARLNVPFFQELDEWRARRDDMPWLKRMKRDLFLSLLFGTARRYAHFWLTHPEATPMAKARPVIARAAVAAIEAARPSGSR